MPYKQPIFRKLLSSRRLALLLVILLGLGLTQIAQAALVWQLQTVDNTGAVGWYTSLALDSNGNPVISYWDTSNFDLKLVHCGNPTCTSGNTIQTVDSAGTVGMYTSLVLAANGNPLISYYDAENGHLKLVYCGTPACSNGNIFQTLDSTALAGQHTSLVLDSSGNPVISYHDLLNGDLKLLRCLDATCSNSTIQTVDSDGLVGEYNSLALDSNGHPVISYSDASNDNLKLVHCGDPTCTTNNHIVTVESDGAVGFFTSLALDNNGNPLISYYEAFNRDLKLVHCGNPDCSSNNIIQIVDGDGAVGWYTSLALDSNGNPVISYYDLGNADLKLVHCGNPDCSTANTIQTVDSIGDVGGYISLALDSNGNPVISHLDVSNGHLRLARLIAIDRPLPPIAGDDAYITNANTPLLVDAPGVLANDSDPANLPPLITQLVSSPEHGTLTLNRDGSFSYAPLQDYIGLDSFTYQARNAALASNVATVTITVNKAPPKNTPPVVNADAFITTVDTSITDNVLTNDSDADGNPLQAIKVDNPLHGTIVLNLDGSFTYTPDTGYLGVDYFIYKANDGLADSPPVKVTVTVNRINLAPIAQNDNYTTFQNTSLIILDPAQGFLANDTDPDGDTLGEAIKRSDPSHGTLGFVSIGTFSYKPEPGYVGVDSFTYQVPDKVADATPATSNIATVMITVKAPQPPVITVVLDAQPDSRTNFKFTGGLGTFTLDDITPADSDAYSNRKSFTVTPGAYTVAETNISGWLVTAITCTPAAKGVADLPNRQVTINAALGDTITCTFTIQRAGQLTAGKYNDHNHNGVRNSKDEWLSGWQMELFTSPSTPLATQNTNTKGRTSFTNLAPGSYTICEMLQAGWFNITPNTLDVLYGKPCYTVTVAPGQMVAALFGNSTTPLVAAAENSVLSDVIVIDLPDTDDDGNLIAPLPDPWLDAPEEQVNTLFLPLVTR